MTKRRVYSMLCWTLFFVSCTIAPFEKGETLSQDTIFDVLPKIRQELIADEDGVGPVALMQFAGDSNELLVYYLSDGSLRRWHLLEESLLSKVYIGIVTTRGIGLDKSGELIIGATQSIFAEDDFGKFTEYINGIGVWNTRTGETVRCFRGPCSNASEIMEEFTLLTTGAVLSNDAQTVAVFNHTAYSQYVIDKPASITIHGIDPENYRTFGQLAIDDSGNLIAIANNQGDFQIHNIDVSFLSALINNKFFGDYREGIHLSILDFEFSPDGVWLGVIQDDEIVIWKMDGKKAEKYYETKVENAQILEYDGNSNFLLVGTRDSIRILDLRTKNWQVAIDTPNMTAFSLNYDSTVLAWGDSDGDVFSWSMP